MAGLSSKELQKWAADQLHFAERADAEAAAATDPEDQRMWEGVAERARWTHRQLKERAGRAKDLEDRGEEPSW